MKKAFLLAVLPAVLVLSSCGVKPAANDKLYLEDTIAHEEVFGEAQEAGQLKIRNPRREGEVSSNPEQSSEQQAAPLTAPVVGVQYQPLTNNKYAVRYIAAIDSLSVTAVWTRDICEASGTRRNQNASRKLVCDKAYSALSSNGEPVTPADFDLDAQYFVVYTLRNIPASDLNSYLFAYLTLSNGSSTVTSLARISRVSGGDTFTIDTTSRHGYFLHGNIKGAEFVDVNDNGGDENWIQETAIQMNAEDEFGVFKYEPGTGEEHTGEHFQCFGTYGDGVDNYCRSNGNGGKKVFHNGSYNLYISKNSGTNNVVYFGGTVSAERLYLNAEVWQDKDNPRFAVYAFTKEGNNVTAETWYDMTATSNEHVFKVDVDNSTYATVIFCRMNPGAAENIWANKWNQSYDLGIPGTNTVNRKYSISNYNGNDACPGTWGSID